ncbi:WecB/TagA/CpsF family glycosyltransferase [bacterium]|nr:WecB/TagA/CpsF family glycosyltransferase [bacterium]
MRLPSAVPFLDREVYPWTKEEAIGWVKTTLGEGGKGNLFTLNPETWNETRGDTLAHAHWIPESVMAVWGMKKKGIKAPRTSGADLVFSLLERHSVPVVCWGGDLDTVQGIEANWCGEASIAAALNGYTSSLEEVVEACRRVEPCLLLAGLGAGRQERALSLIIPLLKSVVGIGVGGVLDILAGKRRRAPRWIVKNGLEAVWRVLPSGRRWKRLAQSHIPFVKEVLR